MQITVTFHLEDDADAADPSHPMGVTNDAYEEILACVMSLGGDDCDIVRTS